MRAKSLKLIKGPGNVRMFSSHLMYYFPQKKFSSNSLSNFFQMKKIGELAIGRLIQEY